MWELNTKKAEEIYIISGGPSISPKDLRKLTNKTTIVVNKSIFFVPNANYFITMDYSFLRKIRKNMRFFRNLKCDKIFVANFAKPELIEENGQIKDSKHNITYNLQPFDVIIKSRIMGNFGFSWKDFRNGNNSGHCAVQLAILLGYKEINLLGMDFNIDKYTHFHRGYGEPREKFQNKLDDYYKTFVHAIEKLKDKRKDIKIYNCSSTSKLKDILPYKTL